MKDSQQAYLSVCAIYRNEARYLPEWLEFHRLVGVERFFLYNNRSTDDHLEVLTPYVDEGSVVWHDWPMFPGQRECYESCVSEHRADARWMAFIDIDEFLFSPPGGPVPDVLREFEERPAVVVNSIFYGTSFHETSPEGLAIENYTRRIVLDAPRNRIVKSIVDPTRTLRIGNVAHYFRYAERAKAWNEQGHAVAGELTREVSVERLRINHYFTRSQEERREKLKRPGILHGMLVPRIEEVEDRDNTLNQEVDEILVPYGRAVRAALAALAAGTPLPVGSIREAMRVA